jgi:adenylate cyclase class IV
MERVLRRLGLCVSFQYAKTREAWRLLWRQEEVLVCLDSTPVGAFVELEGSETAVESLAAQFGWTEFIRQSYVQLYLEGR